MIPDYMREQVLNAKPPDGCCVPGGSVPAVAEGHFTFARAATVGINPHGPWNRKDYLPKECLTLDRDDLDEQFLNRVWEEKTRYLGGVVKVIQSKSPWPESGRWPGKKGSSWHTGSPLPATA